MDTAIPIDVPQTETQATRCYRNLIADLHLLLQAMRRGEMPEPLSERADQVPRMLNEAATRLQGGVW